MAKEREPLAFKAQANGFNTEQTALLKAHHLLKGNAPTWSKKGGRNFHVVTMKNQKARALLEGFGNSPNAQDGKAKADDGKGIIDDGRFSWSEFNNTPNVRPIAVHLSNDEIPSAKPTHEQGDGEKKNQVGAILKAAFIHPQ